jgi:hypothetical protein
MVGRIHVGAGVSAHADQLDGPNFLAGQVLQAHARKAGDQLPGAGAVVEVVDLRPEAGRVGGNAGLQGDRKVNEPLGHATPSLGSVAATS